MLDVNYAIAQAMLAMAVHQPRKITKLLEMVEADELFEYELDCQIWAKCKDLIKKIDLFSPQFIAAELKLEGEDAEYVFDLLDAVPLPSQLDRYLEQVELALYKRGVVQNSIALQSESTLEGIHNKNLGNISKLGALQLRKKASLINIADYFSAFWDELDRRSSDDYCPNSSGFEALDDYRVYDTGRLIVVGGTPGTGKSLFAVNIAVNVAKQFKHSLIFSLEMGGNELMERIVSAETGVETWKFKEPKKMPESDWSKVNEFMASEPLPVMIQTDKTSLADIVSTIRDVHAKTNLECVVIDYLQIMSNSSNADMRLFICEVTRTLKLLAVELNIAIILLSQLSRAMHQTAIKRPQLHHLKESGSIDADADSVLLLYRDMDEQTQSKYVPTASTGEIEIIIAKNRGNRLGTARMSFQPEFSRVKDVPRFGGSSYASN